jgi:phosphoserine phosphatase
MSSTKYKLVAFDFDGVIADTISSWVWVHEHFGVNNDASLELYLDDKINDKEFMRRDIALWKAKKPDISIKDIENILIDVPIMKGTLETIQELHGNKIHTGIISGGLDIMVHRVAKDLGIDYVLANGLEARENGVLTGEGILRVELKNKAGPMQKLLEHFKVDPSETVAVGNGHIDVPMFKFADLKIAFNPDDEIVKNNANIIIEKKDLREILKYVLNK